MKIHKSLNNVEVYAHYRNDTNTIFYVGLGKHKRSNSRRSRSQHWHNIVNKHGYRIDIIHEKLTYELAGQVEMHLIEFYGRKDFGLCHLVNRTDGGAGVSGIIRVASQETRYKMRTSLKISQNKPEFKEKISKIHKGKSLSVETRNLISIAGTNRIVSQETRDKISKLHTGSKRSDNTKDKMREASLKENLSSDTIELMSRWQKGKPRSQEYKDKSNATRARNKELKNKS